MYCVGNLHLRDLYGGHLWGAKVTATSSMTYRGRRGGLLSIRRELEHFVGGLHVGSIELYTKTLSCVLSNIPITHTITKLARNNAPSTEGYSDSDFGDGKTIKIRLGNAGQPGNNDRDFLGVFMGGSRAVCEVIIMRK